jgi:hypothetical protein
MATFDSLSNEAKILFVIGEPLRRQLDLDCDAWITRTVFVWTKVTAKDIPDFFVAFEELSNWIKPQPTIIEIKHAKL